MLFRSRVLELALDLPNPGHLLLQELALDPSRLRRAAAGRRARRRPSGGGGGDGRGGAGGRSTGGTARWEATAAAVGTERETRFLLYWGLDR